jgi:hypothetical protein
MIRQAHTYLVGALSGVVVIGIAIAAFVVLVAGQVFHDLPIPALTSSDGKPAAVSPAKAVTGGPGGQAVASTGTIQPDHAAANRNAAAGAQNGATSSQPVAHQQASTSTPTQNATAPSQVVETAPTESLGGDQGSTAGGKSGGSHSSQPSSTSNAPSSSNSGSVGGGNATSTSGSSSSGNGTPTDTPGSSGGSPTTGTSGSGTTTTSPPPSPVTTAKPSEVITETVNGTVGTVDEATGGTLSETGVSQVTEEVVGNVAGPESVVGKTVDEVGKVVGGLVNGHGE